MGDEERNVVEVEDEEEESAQEAAPVNASPSKIIKILFYVVGAIVALLLIVGISYIVSRTVQEKKYEGEQAIVVAPPPPPLTNFDLPSFSVTTKDVEPHFAKITISLGYEENIELNNELIKRVPQFQHIINVLLSSKRFEDMDTVEKKINLSEEIKAHINMLLSSGKIKEVYFREIVIN